MSKVATRCRGLAVALIALGAFVVTTSPAGAGTYDVLSCDGAPGGSVASWSYSSNDANIAAPAICPTGGATFFGLSLYNAPNNSINSYTGQYASWTFYAPAGTTVDGVLADYTIERRDQHSWWGGWAIGSTVTGRPWVAQSLKTKTSPVAGR